MKYFSAIFCFLFLTLTLQAQMIMDEVAYVPSPSGYYNNLVVQGDTYINQLITDSFNVQSYGTILTLKVASSSLLNIRKINVKNPIGSVIVKESSEEMPTTGSFPNAPSQRKGGEGDKGDEGNNRQYPTYVPFNINGGSISVSSIKNGNSALELRDIETNATPLATIFTNDITNANQEPNIYVDHLSIFGMDIPQCPYNYYWQKVKVGSTVYTVLACNYNGCANPQGEEACLQSATNTCWENCECKSGSSCTLL